MPVSSRDLDPAWVAWAVQEESWRENGRIAGPGPGLRWNVRLLQGQIQAEGTARVGGEWPLETVRFGVADALTLMTHGPATMTRVAVWRFGLAHGAPPCGRPLSRIVLSNGSSRAGPGVGRGDLSHSPG